MNSIHTMLRVRTGMMELRDCLVGPEILGIYPNPFGAGPNYLEVVYTCSLADLREKFSGLSDRLKSGDVMVKFVH